MFDDNKEELILSFGNQWNVNAHCLIYSCNDEKILAAPTMHNDALNNDLNCEVFHVELQN